MQQHDVLILGSGLGGLLCGVILAKNGYNVGIIEQHKQIGGCLQSYAVDKHLFDTCVHYIGGLEPGNTLFQIFNYAEIMEHLSLIPLNQNGFDKIQLGADPTLYPIAQGYENFIEQLGKHFPQHQAELAKYIATLKEVCSKFPLYYLQDGDGLEKMDVMHWSLQETLDRIFTNEQLKQIVCGNAYLYAGQSASTPFYVHALVSSSYMENAYKIKGSSAQIPKYLWKTFQKYGGVIYKNECIKAIIDQQENGYIIQTTNTNFTGKICISNMHPEATLNMLQTDVKLNAFKNRIQSCPNTTSSFLINAVLAPQTVPYKDYNIYAHNGHPLQILDNNSTAWPNQYALYFNQDEKHPEYAASVAILCYCDIEDFKEEANSFHTTNFPNNRSVPYQELKQAIGQNILNKVATKFPDITKHIQTWDAATPLTFRDYMGSTDGSIYGMTANYNQPLLSQVPIKTKIPNFYFTGQNVNLHGILGVSITAVATCGHLLGLSNLLKDIKQA